MGTCNSVKLIGTITDNKYVEAVSQAGKPYAKTKIIIQTVKDYPLGTQEVRMTPVEFFGKKAPDVAAINVGSFVVIEAEIDHKDSVSNGHNVEYWTISGRDIKVIFLGDGPPGLAASDIEDADNV